LSKDYLDGLEMTWGNVEAVRAMLRKIALSEGVGEILAQGVMRAAHQVGGESINCAVHSMKGNTPRGHDHRCAWSELFITSISNSGTLEERAFLIELFDPKEIIKTVVADMGAMYFEDSMGICWFNMGLPGRVSQDKTLILQALKAATGLDLTWEDSLKVGRRAVNLMRAFNYRHGITAESDKPSPRYGSEPAGGPAKGKSIMVHWDNMMKDYYALMGWDTERGIPLPETLKALGLEEVIDDIWQCKQQ
jgi:aldehyde:ferredoxin oxidoreductase